jgi:hypothetical protein
MDRLSALLRDLEAERVPQRPTPVPKPAGAAVSPLTAERILANRRLLAVGYDPPREHSRFRNHRLQHDGPGHWACKCGEQLGASQAAARVRMRAHRMRLAARDGG